MIALKNAFALGKNKPVKARKVDKKIDDMWDKLDDGILTISQFLELACNFFEPDRDLPRPTFDTSARPARPGGNVRRGRATAGQRQTRRRTTRQSVEVHTSDSNGNICYF